MSTEYHRNIRHLFLLKNKNLLVNSIFIMTPLFIKKSDPSLEETAKDLRAKGLIRL